MWLGTAEKDEITERWLGVSTSARFAIGKKGKVEKSISFMTWHIRLIW
jgi:hypothetical protein